MKFSIWLSLSLVCSGCGDDNTSKVAAAVSTAQATEEETNIDCDQHNRQVALEKSKEQKYLDDSCY